MKSKTEIKDEEDLKELVEFYEDFGIKYLIVLKIRKEIDWLSFFVVLFTGIVEVAIGVCLICSGCINFGAFLLKQGIKDIKSSINVYNFGVYLENGTLLDHNEACKEAKIDPSGSAFYRTADEIKDIVKVCKELGIELSGTVFQRTAGEIKDIVKTCKEVGIEPSGTVFKRTADEIKDIVNVCREAGIKPSGTVFQRTAGEITDIVEVCKEEGIEPSGTVFQRTAGEIKDIVKVCKENGIEITGSVFMKTAEKLKQNIDYIKENFGSEYLLPLVISKDNKNLRKVLPYLKEKGYIESIKSSASILSLTLDKIQERERFIEKLGEQVINSKGKFNSIFGMSKKNYEKRVKEAEKRQADEILPVIESVPIIDSEDASQVLNDMTKDNKKNIGDEE